jgi:AcrR family transcriptional regulator
MLTGPFAESGANAHIIPMVKRSAAARPAPAVRIVDAALALAAREGWRSISLAAIAAEAGMTVLELYAVYRSKAAILEAFHRRVDAATLAGAGEEGDERPRDRLFDILMRRFDALGAHKKAVAAIARDAAADPLVALCGVPALLNSIGWMLEAAGVSASGWVGRARVKLLLGIYLSVFRVWLADDSADMTRTMAALDSRLRAAETWLGLAAPAAAQPTGRAAAS